MPSIVHLTSVHPRYDTRIFLKQCRSLAAAGHQVVLVVADGKADEERDGVRIIDVGAPSGRLRRMSVTTRDILAKARELDADLYQFHDPELLPVGLALKWGGKRVVFDAHEDVSLQLGGKSYVYPALRQPLAWSVGAVERVVARRLDAIITATPAIRDKFSGYVSNATCISNFPISDELHSSIEGRASRQDICYVGGISRTRGVVQVVEALELTGSGAKLSLAGRFEASHTREKAMQLAGWSKVQELGFLSRAQVRDLLGRSIAGIVTFLPEPNHVAAQPNKMFEYMSAGLPVIASNFPLWRQIIEGNECGICVDPHDPKTIAAAIDRLVENPELARRMGENGRRAVEERYNWGVEERKLLELYDRLLAGG